MANLKDIDYGIGKYLEVSDASGIPGIGINRTNLDLLNFKLAVNNAYALYNFKDGIIDAYQDATGVDASGSTDETRDSSGKYYSGYLQTVESVTSSGGTVTTDGDYTVHKFTSSGNYITDKEQTDYEILVVGGGGAGGTYGPGGGGGGGGVYTATGITVTAATHTVVVGAGGTGSAAYPVADGAMDGENSTFDAGPATYTGYKGGMGGGQSTNSSGGAGYGSGGGGSGNGSGPTSGYNGGAGGTGGNAGGVGYNPNGGGGGGAGAAGASVTTSAGPAGNGGVGIASDILVTGSDVYYGGGGGGGRHGSGTAGTGGNGGGADGQANSCGNAPDAPANTGGGGGGAGGIPASCGGTSGDGGSGIVIIRRPTQKTTTTYNNMTLVSNAQTAAAQPSTARVTVFEHPSTGTTTLNTDIKAYASRDNGTTYTQVTLTDDGEYESGKKLLSGSADISGQPAGTSMRYKIETLNQSAGKITRLHGVSLQWAQINNINSNRGQ